MKKLLSNYYKLIKNITFWDYVLAPCSIIFFAHWVKFIMANGWMSNITFYLIITCNKSIVNKNYYPEKDEIVSMDFPSLAQYTGPPMA